MFFSQVKSLEKIKKMRVNTVSEKHYSVRLISNIFKNVFLKIAVS